MCLLESNSALCCHAPVHAQMKTTLSASLLVRQCCCQPYVQTLMTAAPCPATAESCPFAAAAAAVGQHHCLHLHLQLRHVGPPAGRKTEQTHQPAVGKAALHTQCVLAGLQAAQSSFQVLSTRSMANRQQVLNSGPQRRGTASLFTVHSINRRRLRR